MLPGLIAEEEVIREIAKGEHNPLIEALHRPSGPCVSLKSRERLSAAHHDNFFPLRCIVVAYLRARLVLPNGELDLKCAVKSHAAVTQSRP